LTILRFAEAPGTLDLNGPAHDRCLEFSGQANMPTSQILPVSPRTSLAQRRATTLSAALFEDNDAVLLICDPANAETALASLPHAALWQELYAAARKRGPVGQLSSRVQSRSHALVSIGMLKDKASAFEVLSLAGRLWKSVADAAPRRIAVATLGLTADKAVAPLEALLSATLAGLAPLPQFKSKRRPPPAPVTLTVLHAGKPVDLKTAEACHAGNHLARWLTTLPPDVLDCVAYRKALKVLATTHGWRFEFLDEARLKRLGAGAFLAVARSNPHRGAGIVRLTYRPKARARGRLALVGKGICFDTGGINLKPHKSMYSMHEDMQGSAVAVGTLLAMTMLGSPYEIDCWLALTENQIGPNAYRPQEIVTAVNGKTIQVVHSDAEGRMVLADTLALAAKQDPAVIIDFATLTGACIMALTERYSGIFTNRPEWRPHLEAAGRESGERVWNFPMDEDFDSDLDSSVADLLQCSMDGKGDHILAARFLSHFVPEGTPWIHVDLAASNHRGGLAHIPSDFTGFGVRFTTHLLGKGDLLS